MNMQKLELALELLSGIEPTAHMTPMAQAYWANAAAAIREARADNSTKSQAAYEQAIEDAYFAGFKKALAAPTAQEPVAWRYTSRGHYRYRGYVPNFDVEYKVLKPQALCLCTTPPVAQRQWVGLTAEQIASIPLNEHTLQTAERLLKDNNA